MKVLNYIFKNQTMPLYQDTDMFNFSIDSLILARLSNLKITIKKILEIGTNNGIISIVLAKRSPNLEITALEIQAEAVELANENFIINKVDKNINLINTDFNLWYSNNKTNKFEAIICNPPFYKLADHKINPNKKLEIARHESKLTAEDIFSKSANLLINKGSLHIIYPAYRLSEIILLSTKYDFAIKLMRFIHPFIDKPSKSVFIELIYQGRNKLIINKPIIVHDQNNNYSKEIDNLYTWKNKKEVK